MSDAPASSPPPRVVAIDGISGSGKSSTARLLARDLGYAHLDTGAMYRVAAWLALKQGIAPGQHAELARLAEGLDFSLSPEGALWFREAPLPLEIRSAEVSAVVSEYCRPPELRRALVRRQRELGLSRPSVVEGRDIGTVVFPDAPFKFYLTARPEARARRRARELEAAGLPGSYEEILRNLQDRDHKDMSRAHSPLQKASDAREIDTSDYSLEQQVAILSNLVRGRP